jgi:hypothetical protein
MIDTETFTEEQTKFLQGLVTDLDGPTHTATLLYIIERLLDELKPNWKIGNIVDDDKLRSDLQVCLAALQYVKEIQSG